MHFNSAGQFARLNDIEVARQPRTGQPAAREVKLDVTPGRAVQFSRQDFFGMRRKINFLFFLVGDLRRF